MLSREKICMLNAAALRYMSDRALGAPVPRIKRWWQEWLLFEQQRLEANGRYWTGD
jgi:hypothetical protein